MSNVNRKLRIKKKAALIKKSWGHLRFIDPTDCVMPANITVARLRELRKHEWIRGMREGFKAGLLIAMIEGRSSD